MKTLVQYENQLRDDCCTRHGIPKAEYMHHYPRGCRLEEWRGYVQEQAQAGHVLPPIVLDRYTQYFGRAAFMQLIKFWPACMPNGYLNPIARQEQAT